MYEKMHHKLASLELFLKRVFLNFTIGLGLILCALSLGMAGYMHFEGMDLVSAYENAAMILSGMGPVTQLHTTGGRIFAGSYALFSGVIFLVVIAVVFAPIFHRCFHHFLIKDED